MSLKLNQSQIVEPDYDCFKLCSYAAINKPAGVLHWLIHSEDAKNVDWVVILDADMIMRHPMIPWELGVQKGRPLAAYYG